MLIFLEKLFDEERCDKLSKILMDYHNRGKLSFEGNNQHYKNSFGASLPEFNAILNELTPLVKEKTGYTNLSVKNSYSRIYFNNSVLKKHVDRKGLDVTMSVCIFDNTGKDWPLYVVTEDGVKSAVTKVGDGVMILGTKMEHWRDNMTCAEDQMVMQVFFHWEFI